MGAFLSFLWTKKTYQVAMIGLDAAGKTTILNYLKSKFGNYAKTANDPGKNRSVEPTIGFNQAELEIGNFKLALSDVGGQDSMRNFWSKFVGKSSHVIFVVDSIDRDRIGLAAEELRKMMDYTRNGKGTPLLILANKQDLQNPMKKDEIIKKLNLNQISIRFNVFETVATSSNPEEIINGILWLKDQDPVAQ